MMYPANKSSEFLFLPLLIVFMLISSDDLRNDVEA
jgi:hypothetical protein